MERVRVVSAFLVGLFFASMMTNFIISDTNKQQQTLVDVEHDPMFATGYHSSSALLVQEFEIIEFNDQSPPYRWVKLYGQSDLTYINVTSSSNSSSWSQYGQLTAYTAHDVCVFQGAFYIDSFQSFECNNPTNDPIIVVKIDYSTPQDPSQSRLTDNVSVNISVGHGISSPPQPPMPTTTADGDLFGDSTYSNQIHVPLSNGVTSTIEGTFEWSNDEDYVSFATHQTGTHQLVAKFNQSVDAVPLTGLTDCEYDYNNGFETIQSRFSNIGEAVEYKGGHVFSATTPYVSGGLWFIDDLRSEPVLLMSAQNPYGSASNYVVYGNTLIFSAYSDGHGTELWRSDGTASGTWMIDDLRQGTSSSAPTYLEVHGNHVYFRATMSSGQTELHRTDGTASGTSLIVDLAGYSSANPSYLTSFGGQLIFVASDEYGHQELWQSDGTAQGTVVLKTINPSYGSSPQWLTVAGNRLFFTANDPTHGREIWVSDGTSMGTSMVKDLSNGYSSSTVYPAGTTGNQLFFFKYIGGNKELWISDGTSQGTVQIPTIPSQMKTSSPVVSIGDKHYLIAINPTNSTADVYRLNGGQPQTPTHLTTLVVNQHPSSFEMFSAGEDLYLRSRYSYSTEYKSYHLDENSGLLSPVDFGQFQNLAMGSSFIQGDVYSIRSTNGITLFNPSAIANERATTLSCTITSTSPTILIQQSNDNGNIGNVVWNWSMDAYTAAQYPNEDARTGDSSSPVHRTVLPHNGSKIGGFHVANDHDYYSIPIEHGTTQTIEVKSKGEVQYTLANPEHCFGEPGSLNGSTDYTYTVMIICDTENMTDEIQITINAHQSAHQHSWPHYSIGTGAEMKPRFQAYLTNNSVQDDIPSTTSSTKLVKDQAYNGTFLFRSDTVDRFLLDLEEGERIEVQLMSNCATVRETKSSYMESYEYHYGWMNSWNTLIQVDARLSDSLVHTIDVERLYQTSATDLELKKQCDYSISYSSAQPQTFDNVMVSHDLRLSDGQSLTLDSFDHDLDGVQNEQITSYMAVFPIDISPLKNGKISVQQASNQPVELMVYLSQHSPLSKNLHATNETEFGQNVDVGFAYVQWNRVLLSGLDGSALTISMEETTLSQSSTRESGELFSGGQGALGMSADEGWDLEDSWVFNNTELVTYFSVLLIEEKDTLDASFSTSATKKISELRCEQQDYFGTGTGDFAPVQLNHRDGSGQYTLEVQRGFSETCPSDAWLSAPSTISQNSDFRVMYQSNVAGNITLNLLNENLAVVYSSGIVENGVWHPITDLPELIPGPYTLIARDINNVVVAEQAMTITSEPHLTSYVTESVLDVLQKPKIYVNAYSEHTYEPKDWELVNLEVSGIDRNEVVFSVEYAEDFEGTGSRILTLTDLPTLLSGSHLIATATIISEEYSVNYSWIWRVGFIEPTTTCQSDFSISYDQPQNQLLCSVDFSLSTHGSEFAVRTEESFNGRLEIYSTNGTMVTEVAFESDRFAPTPVRIDFDEIRQPGAYKTSLVMEDAEKYFFTESTSEFVVNGFLPTEVEATQIGDFQFSMLPVRNRATAGDDVTLLWTSEGQIPDYLIVDVYTAYLEDGQELVYSTTFLADGTSSGELKISLPESVNPYLDHTIQVMAVSEFGETSLDITELQGLPQAQTVDLYISPTNPTIGEKFDVILSNPSGDEWLSWEWQLLAGSTVLGSDIGFVEANSATIPVELPLAQYTSNPVFQITVETLDGTIHDISRTIVPLPMRTVTFEFQDSLVAGKDAEFEYQLEGIFLNQMDNIQKIDLLLYSLAGTLVHQEQFFGNDTEGKNEILLPESINPGTYNVIVRFTFADGTEYSHIETAQVLGEPEGINLLGLTIPPLMMGLDTLLVIGLIAHAVVLHRRMRASDDDEADVVDADDKYDDDDFTDEFTMPLLDELDTQQVEETEVDDFTEETSSFTSQGGSNHTNTIDVSNPDLYQEYPAGSGRYWSRNSVEDEWQLIE